MSEREGTGAALPTLVAAVDNDRMALLALKAIVPQLLPGARWLWGAQTADEAVARALDPETRPKLLLVDMSLGESTGVEVCRRIRLRTDRVALLAVTAFQTHDYADRVAEAGAQGIVSKADMPRLMQAVRTVAAGGVYGTGTAVGGAADAASDARTSSAVSGIETGAASTENAGDAPGITRASGMTGAIDAHAMFHTPSEAHRILVERTDAAEGKNEAPKLGAKEAETLHLLSRGFSYEQIASQWGIAASTVRTHAHRAVEKLGANSLAHAIALWLSA